MKGRLVLSGGGDEKQTFVLDEIFLKAVTKILYIPVAWANDDFDSCLRWFTNAMSAHKPIKIDMLADLHRSVRLRDYDAVYIGGGNTFKLLKRIKDSGFDKKLLEYYNSGGTVYGGSAGAAIWGKDINITTICADADENIVGLKDTGGFDALQGWDIQCHYTPAQLKEHQDFIAKSGRNVIAIPEESACLLEDNRIEVIGLKAVALITKTSSKYYEVGKEIRLEAR